MRKGQTLSLIVCCCGFLLQSTAFAGTLIGWGRNDYGQATPPDRDDFVAVSCGDYHAVGLTSSGSLLTWGRDWHGVLDAPTGNGFTGVASGDRHVLALRADGSLTAWGSNDYGECDVPLGNEFVAIAAGDRHSLALRSDGTIAAWGSNLDYAGRTANQAIAPSGSDFVDISAGQYHSLALNADGSAIAWGLNASGQCSVPSGALGDLAQRSGYHSLAVRPDGSVAAWGNNTEGECLAPEGTDFVQVIGGGWHSLGLRADGTVEAWGQNEYGQCDVPAGITATALAAGQHSSIALMESSTLPSQKVLSGVPAYEQFIFHYVGDTPSHNVTCGPIAVGSMLGYHDVRGFDDLFPEASGFDQVRNLQNVKGSIVNLDDMWDPVSEDDPDWNDVNKTAQAIEDFAYQRGYEFDAEYRHLVVKVGYGYVPVPGDIFGQVWDRVVTEIDNDRPLVFFVNADAGGAPNHFITVIGYDEEHLFDDGHTGRAFAYYLGNDDDDDLDMDGDSLPDGMEWEEYRTWWVGDNAMEIAGYAWAVPVPEPATMSLLALGGLALIRRRRTAR